jgi:hypothetical protein
VLQRRACWRPSVGSSSTARPTQDPLMGNIQLPTCDCAGETFAPPTVTTNRQSSMRKKESRCDAVKLPQLYAVRLAREALRPSGPCPARQAGRPRASEAGMVNGSS